ncbi:MAG: serine hydrolase [Clostridia bacterium]|nr:serine hydrolase [Clostridia bacterium]
MKYLSAYRALASLLGPRARENAVSGVFAGDGKLRREALSALRRARVYGASLCVFDREGIAGEMQVGFAREGVPVMPGTFFRAASVSKMVTGAIALRLAAEGKLDLDMDAGKALGIRAPKHKDARITPKMLLSHTSSIRDTDLLERAARGMTLSEAAPRFAYTGASPGEAFVYSNEGAALLGALLEMTAGKDLDELYQEAFGLPGSYFPNRLEKDVLADAVKIVPKRKIAYNGADMQALETGPVCADPQRHWGRAHGSLCLRASDAANIAMKLRTDARYAAMFAPQIPFGSRDPMITEGLAMFLLGSPFTGVCGHQGLAYGAAHGVFFSKETGYGFALLTSGCSLARKFVLTDLNLALIRLFTEEKGRWKR